MANRHDTGARRVEAINVGDVLPRVFRKLGGEEHSLDDHGNLVTIFEAGWQRMWTRMAELGVSYDAAVKHREALWADIIAAIKHCDSPIERALLCGLMVADYPGTHVVPMVVHNPKTDLTFPDAECVLVPQFAFAKYRMDFGLVCRLNGRQLILDIECDGLAYHQDKIVDKARDVYLESWGIPVIRLKGSEIHQYPLAAADRVISRVIEWRNA